MRIKNLTRIFVLGVFGISLFSCKTEEIPLHGDITGIVKDAETNESIGDASVKVMRLNATYAATITENDGTYLLKNITPGDYEIQTSKLGYATKTENVIVNSHMTKEINFSLPKIPIINVSSTLLDFGLDSTTLKFNILKVGSGILGYKVSTSQSWITTSPSNSEINEGDDSAIITVNINRIDLVKRKYIETITVTDKDETQEVKIDVYLNGVMDTRDNKYYNIVRIGTQVWMSENLNVGIRLDGVKDQINNGIIIEKYCYGDGELNCDEYGGLYQWNEMMQYNPAEDTATTTGKTQGICPDGWHIPTDKEWATLWSSVGGDGGKLKETGTVHWAPPNSGATNESGFTALPGGFLGADDFNTAEFEMIGTRANWWSSNLYGSTLDVPSLWFLDYEIPDLINWMGFLKNGLSVRCVRNP